jgi:hypothetical protein
LEDWNGKAFVKKSHSQQWLKATWITTYKLRIKIQASNFYKFLKFKITAKCCHKYCFSKLSTFTKPISKKKFISYTQIKVVQLLHQANIKKTFHKLYSK